MDINGWRVLAHPLFLDQLEKLTAAVARARDKDPKGYRKSANAKTLAAIHHLAFQAIPADPTRADHRQGDTLGDAYKHWFRAKFGNGRFRLFFRYSSEAKVIVLAWVNDSDTLRTYGSKTDADAVFRKMLASGDPPDAWTSLRAAALAQDAQRRFDAVAKAVEP